MTHFLNITRKCGGRGGGGKERKLSTDSSKKNKMRDLSAPANRITQVVRA